MGKKKKTSAPQVPGPSAIEQQIQQQQLALMQQQLAQSQKAFEQSQQDRVSLQSALETMQNGGRALTADEQKLIDDLTNQYSKTLNDGINTGIVGQQLERSRDNSIASLIDRGVLNSTTGAQMLGDIEKERSRLLADAANQTSQTRLDLTNQFRTNAANANTAASNLLAGGQAQLQNYATAAGQLGAQTGQGVAQQAYAQRMAQYQRDMGMWQYNQAKPKTNWGGLVGAGLGAALAIPTGGMSLAGGALLGSTLGGGLGSMF